jgi:hypothetical protein
MAVIIRATLRQPSADSILKHIDADLYNALEQLADRPQLRSCQFRSIHLGQSDCSFPMLTLRLIDPNDYFVLEDGQPIGRIRHARALSPPIWLWTSP